MDIVCATERAYYAFFRQRVFLLGYGFSDIFVHPAACRPIALVCPVRLEILLIPFQLFISVEPGTVVILENIFAVLTGAGKIHQSVRLIRRVVELVDTDIIGDKAADCLILVRRYGAAERQDKPHARFLRAVFMRGVDTAGIIAQCEYKAVP